MTRIERLFYAYCVVASVILAGVVLRWPHTADFVIKPFFWFLGIVGAFDLGNFFINKGDLGTIISMQTRFIGLFLGLAIFATALWWFGVPVRLF